MPINQEAGMPEWKKVVENTRWYHLAMLWGVVQCLIVIVGVIGALMAVLWSVFVMRHEPVLFTFVQLIGMFGAVFDKCLNALLTVMAVGIVVALFYGFYRLGWYLGRYFEARERTRDLLIWFVLGALLVSFAGTFLFGSTAEPGSIADCLLELVNVVVVSSGCASFVLDGMVARRQEARIKNT